MKIVQIGQDDGIQRWLTKLGHKVDVVEGLGGRINEPMHPDIVVFTGGSDVSPFLYNHENIASGSNAQRDIIEIAWFHKFYDIFKLGICRGGQFLNVMSGGKMNQDFPKHAIAGTHEAYFSRSYGKDTYNVTSTHHQLIMPSQEGYLLATANQNKGQNETESVWYGHTRSLCFQPHPEYESENPEDGLYSDRGTNYLLLKCVLETGGKQLYPKGMEWHKEDKKKEPVAKAAAAKPQFGRADFAGLVRGGLEAFGARAGGGVFVVADGGDGQVVRNDPWAILDNQHQLDAAADIGVANALAQQPKVIVDELDDNHDEGAEF